MTGGFNSPIVNQIVHVHFHENDVTPPALLSAKKKR